VSPDFYALKPDLQIQMHALVQDTVPENGVQRHYLFFFTSEASKLSTKVQILTLRTRLQ
jgi:hypothetical protein